MRLFHGNIAGKRRVPELVPVLRDRRPNVVECTEAYRGRRYLRRIGRKHGYELRQYGVTKGAEGPDVAILVRNDTPILERECVKMTKRWWGPFRFPFSKRKPRRYQRLVLLADGHHWDALGIHLPSGGPSGGIQTRGKNGPAWHESADHVREFMASTLLGFTWGDFNAKGADLRHHIAGDGARVVMASNVDGVIAKGAQVSLHRLDAPAGMHGWFVADLTPKENR
jgi:hypothetical protein